MSTPANLGRPGKPRQPYCPDCRKEGKPFILKKAGQGYCKEHHYKRSRAAYFKRMKEANPEYVPIDDRDQRLEQDIRNAVKQGMAVTPDLVRKVYAENGFSEPTDEKIQELLGGS